VNKLREIRLIKGLTQENVAYELGISQKAYSNLENGKTCLSQENLLKLSKIFNVTPDVFCKNSCECHTSNSSIKEKMKLFLQDRGIELPDFLK
jgi:transcriptional regulator with XRE-family HTH domain